MQDIKNLILVIPEKYDEEREEVAIAWEKLGGLVERIGRFWDPPQLDTKRVRLYGNHIFCLILAQKYKLDLISPEDDLLVKISDKWINRKLHIDDLKSAVNLNYPIFINPVIPKLFSAKVYKNYAELCEECRQLDNSTKVIISEIVDIQSEIRAFILDGKIMSLAVYEGNQDLILAEKFLKEFLKENIEFLPNTFVIDLGFMGDRGWNIIEFNATRGAGLNGCDGNKAVYCIAAASTQGEC